MRQLSERLRQPMLTWVTTFHEAANALLTGDPDRAEDLAGVALQVGTDSGQPDAFAFYGTQLLGARIIQGRLGELTPLVAELVSDNPTITAYRSSLCLAHLEGGDNRAALELLERSGADGFVSVNHDTTWMDGMSNYAKTAIELQAVGPAGHLIGLLEPFHGQVPFEGLLAQAPVATDLGGLAAVLGLYDRAEAYFEEAAALNARGGMRFAEAYTNLLWGRMLRTRGAPGDENRARALLEEARASAATRGYALIERRAAAELSTLG
jgi:tetratricopeptide (TPR) repeat protein